MKLLDVPPCSLLADFIECYWHVDVAAHESTAAPDAILPNGTSNLIFNLSGNPHREHVPHALDRFDLLKTRWFSGLRDGLIVVGPTVCTKVVGIRFKAAGLAAFVRVPPHEVVGVTLDPDALWGRDSYRLHEQLLDLPSVQSQFRLLERWLLKRLNPFSLHVGLLRSVKRLEASAGNVAIEQLARAADLSPRQYRRRFEQAVGLPPKRLARILRFQKLIRQIAASPEPNWAALAFDCGYYDQAHLIADFRDFADVTPSEYVRRRPVVPGFLPVDAPVSLFSNTPPGSAIRIATG